VVPDSIRKEPECDLNAGCLLHHGESTLDTLALLIPILRQGGRREKEAIAGLSSSMRLATVDLNANDLPGLAFSADLKRAATYFAIRLSG